MFSESDMSDVYGDWIDEETQTVVKVRAAVPRAAKLAVGSEPIMYLVCMFPAAAPGLPPGKHAIAALPRDTGWLTLRWPKCEEKVPLCCRVQTAVTRLMGLRTALAQTAL